MTKRSSAKGSGRPAKVRVKSAKRLMGNTREERAAAKELINRTPNTLKANWRVRRKTRCQARQEDDGIHQGASGAPAGEEWTVTMWHDLRRKFCQRQAGPGRPGLPSRLQDGPGGDRLDPHRPQLYA